MEKQINPEWQELREKGMLVREIADRYGVRQAYVCAHTYPTKAMKQLKRKKSMILDLYQMGMPVTQIAGTVNIDTTIVRSTLSYAIKHGQIKRRGGRPAKKPVYGAIPEDLKRRDDCPNRVTRGLTSEEYKRLLEVNREYDKRRLRKDDEDK